jgi:hypothetical protein
MLQEKGGWHDVADFGIRKGSGSALISNRTYFRSIYRS